MDRLLNSRLYDNLTAIDEIYSFFNQVPKQFTNIEVSDMRAIIATRNRVIHDYAAITDDVMWKIVINDLPKLRAEVLLLIK